MADTEPRRVCVIGLGYVGLPTAASIAAQGVEVIGVDVDAERLSAIGAGAPPTAEGDLGELVRKVVAAGRLRTAATPRPADAFIIAVPTPHGPDHAPDVSFVRASAERPGAPAASRQPGGAGVHVPRSARPRTSVSGSPSRAATCRSRTSRGRQAMCASRTAPNERSPGTCCTS